MNTLEREKEGEEEKRDLRWTRRGDPSRTSPMEDEEEQGSTDFIGSCPEIEGQRFWLPLKHQEKEKQERSGSKDAKKKNVEHILILSGDHLYRTDYMDFVQKHVNLQAGIMISLPMDDSYYSKVVAILPKTWVGPFGLC